MNALIVAVVLLWLVVLGLVALVLALARQVGMLHERVAPVGALVGEGGPAPGEASPRFELTGLAGERVRLGLPDGERSTLVFFLSPTCPVCKKLLPALTTARRAEADWLDVVLASDGGDAQRHRDFARRHGIADFPYLLSAELGLAFRVQRLPYAVLVDEAGIVRAKGLVNSREQLESLFHARDLGVPSVQALIAGGRDRPAASNALA